MEDHRACYVAKKEVSHEHGISEREAVKVIILIEGTKVILTELTGNEQSKTLLRT